MAQWQDFKCVFVFTVGMISCWMWCHVDKSDLREAADVSARQYWPNWNITDMLMLVFVIGYAAIYKLAICVCKRLYSALITYIYLFKCLRTNLIKSVYRYINISSRWRTKHEETRGRSDGSVWFLAEFRRIDIFFSNCSFYFHAHAPLVFTLS